VLCAEWGSQLESLLLTLDGLMMVVVIYMGLRDDRRAPGAKLRSLFRMTETGNRPVDDAADERRRRVARGHEKGSRI
jgi:hypothetical protein